MDTLACPTRERWEAYLRGDVAPAEDEALTAHYDRCPHCPLVVEALSHGAESVEDVPGDTFRQKILDLRDAAVATPSRPEASSRRLGPRYADFVRDLLRRRLRGATALSTAAFGLFLAKDFVNGEYRILQPHVAFVVHAGVTFGLLALTALVWGRPSLGMTALRAVETIFVTLGVAFFVDFQVELVQEGLGWAAPAALDDVLQLIADRVALRWVVAIVMYGFFVPNTLRRCLAVVGVLAAVPLTVTVVLGAVTGLLPRLVDPLLEMTTWLALASALSVYGSYKIAFFRKAGFEGRKLGQYVIRRLLGKGGMGEVYLAEHALLRRPCALKVIRPERTEDATVLRRFEREVMATAKLRHENIVAIHDYGHAEDGTFYYVMEYVPGRDLQELVARHGPLPPERVVHFLRQAGAALHKAHSVGLIHRDVKPNNMIACAPPGVCDQLKLVDFGLVRDVGRQGGGDTLTEDDVLVGTPSFMSPEQAAGARDLDARSDVYSLGAVAYFLLTGAPPFVRPTRLGVLMAHLRDPVTPPGRSRIGVPADVEDCVLRCLEKDAARRFPTAEALAESLARCACAGAWTSRLATDWWREKEPEAVLFSSPAPEKC